MYTIKVLIIGNGFDLAHNLKTSYTDFLDFLNVVLELYDNQENSSYSIDDTKPKYKQTFEYCYFILNDSYTKKYIFNLVSNNCWVNYFTKLDISKNGWVDFESEISNVLQKIEELYLSCINIENPDTNKINELNRYLYDTFHLYEKQYQKHPIKDILRNHTSLISCFNSIIDILLSDLNKMTHCLEIYLERIINNKQPDIRLPDIKNITFDKILSFNYTNTFERIYGRNKECEYDYIHGKAKCVFCHIPILQENIEECNLILGIDEYLKNERRNSDNIFIQFKKFFQRIYKKTGNNYAKWISGVQDVIDVGTMHYNSMELHILGHSLSSTDGDILSKFILRQNTTTTIYYHNNKDLNNKIINLIKIIGQEELIERVHRTYDNIIFQEQQKAIKKGQ